MEDKFVEMNLIARDQDLRRWLVLVKEHVEMQQEGLRQGGVFTRARG